MANTRAVAEFARQFIAEGHPLDVLVNNAGCMLHKRVLTDDGFESNFAVNTLGSIISMQHFLVYMLSLSLKFFIFTLELFPTGPYVLTSLLLPLLKKSSDPRVVRVFLF